MSATLPISQRREKSWTCPFCDHTMHINGTVRGRPANTCTNCGAVDDGSGNAVQADPPTPCPTCGATHKEEH